MRYRKVWGANGSTRVYEDDVLVSGTEPHQADVAFFMRDIEQHYGAPIISPIDGTAITSRSQLREHNIRHNVRQNGDYRPGEVVAAENKRRGHAEQDKGITFTWN
jgi:hypothetical protein